MRRPRMTEAKNGKDRRPGTETFSEIWSQAESWTGTMNRIDRYESGLVGLFDGAAQVIFAGCGSAYNASFSIAPLFQHLTGTCCRPVHASEFFLFNQMFFLEGKNTTAVFISRSGTTTETLTAQRKAAELGCRTLAITCFPESPMAMEADLSIVLEEASEKSVTTTRSFTAMVLAGNYLAAKAAGNKTTESQYRLLPGVAARKMPAFQALAERINKYSEIRKFAFVGSGTYYGLAREAQLKIKETTLLPSDSYVSLDYQHGPMSNVDEHMLVTILSSDAGHEYDQILAHNMKKLGGRVLVLTDRSVEDFMDCSDFVLQLGSGLGDGIRDILYMPTLQFLAWHKSVSEGQDPDHPKNLHYFVEV
jgi:glucosamine--fructose-6-phosphate aminotransferase (isomerizing)